MQLPTLERPPPLQAISVIERWADTAAAEARRLDPRNYRACAALACSRASLALMSERIGAGAPVHVFALATGFEAKVEEIESIAMVECYTLRDHSGQLAAFSRLQALMSERGGGVVGVAEVVAFAASPAPGELPKGSKTQLIRRINNWAAANNCLVVFNPEGTLGNSFKVSLEAEPIRGREPYMLYTGSRWVSPDFQMVRLAHGDGEDLGGGEYEALGGGGEIQTEESNEWERHRRERAIGIIDDWAALASAAGDQSGALARPNLEAMRAAVGAGAPVRLFALTTDGGIEGTVSIAMVNSSVFVDHSGQLAVAAQDQGVTPVHDGGGVVGVVELVAFAARPDVDPERGARTQFIRRLKNWALAKNCVVVTNPEGALGKNFTRNLPFERLRGHEPYRLYTGSGWEYRKFSFIGLV